jgi:hypothetical protein
MHCPHPGHWVQAFTKSLSFMRSRADHGCRSARVTRGYTRGNTRGSCDPRVWVPRRVKSLRIQVWIILLAGKPTGTWIGMIFFYFLQDPNLFLFFQVQPLVQPFNRVPKCASAAGPAMSGFFCSSAVESDRLVFSQRVFSHCDPPDSSSFGKITRTSSPVSRHPLPLWLAKSNAIYSSPVCA